MSLPQELCTYIFQGLVIHRLWSITKLYEAYTWPHTFSYIYIYIYIHIRRSKFRNHILIQYLCYSEFSSMVNLQDRLLFFVCDCVVCVCVCVCVTSHVITYLCLDWSWTVLLKRSPEQTGNYSPHLRASLRRGRPEQNKHEVNWTQC